MNALANFPWIAWGLSVAASFVLGWLWYSKLFLKSWAASEQIRCKCGADMAEGEECTCRDNRSMWVMLLQLAANAMVGFVYFLVVRTTTVWLPAALAVAFSAWQKASTLFRIWDNRRAMVAVAIEVGYFMVVSALFIAVAALCA